MERDGGRWREVKEDGEKWELWTRWRLVAEIGEK